jgi:gas vesicle protein
MKTLLIVLLVLAVAAGAVYVATKYFKAFKDEDKDGIPDVVEDKYDDIKEDVEDAIEDVKEVAKTVKKRAKRVKEELSDVADAIGDVVEQSKDVAGAAKGKPRKGRKPAAKK